MYMRSLSFSKLSKKCSDNKKKLFCFVAVVFVVAVFVVVVFVVVVFVIVAIINHTCLAPLYLATEKMRLRPPVQNGNFTCFSRFLYGKHGN